MAQWLAVLFAFALLAGPALAQAPGAIVDSKSERSPVDRKIHPDILFAARTRLFAQTNAGAEPIDVPAQVHAFMAREVATDGSVFVIIRAEVTSGLRDALAAVRATEVLEYPQYRAVTGRVALTAIREIAQLPEVKSIGPREEGETQRHIPSAEERAAFLARTKDAIANTGTTAWEGVVAHRANIVHGAGVTGAGVKVCAMSDGVDTLALRQAAGELPAVQVLSGQAGTGDEGTALLEVIADMAPGA